MPANKPKITDRVTQGRQKNKNGRPIGRKRLPYFLGDTLDSQLASIGAQLLANLTEGNRKKLRKKASFLTQVINKRIKILQGIQGRSYNEKLGVFVDQARAKDAEAYAKLKHEEYVRPVRQITPAATLTRRQKVEKPTPQASPITHPFELELLKEDLTKGQWYATYQVRALTGEHVPTGHEQLSSHIENNKDKQPLTFSYLKIPDKSDSSLNHFVSIHIDPAAKEITYMDPMGDKISKEDQRRLQETFPGAKLFYLNERGKKIDQKTAEASPDDILRVQYDGHNCGMYSTELTKMMQKTRGNNLDLATEIEEIKKLHKNPDAKRSSHTKDLKMVYNRVAAISPATPTLTARKRKSGR